MLFVDEVMHTNFYPDESRIWDKKRGIAIPLVFECFFVSYWLTGVTKCASALNALLDVNLTSTV
jgi:hypothetical protein